jgi:hypothetical protein
VEDCLHYDHIVPTVIPDRETLNLFLRDELFPEIPGFEQERQDEWEKFQTDRSKRTKSVSHSTHVKEKASPCLKNQKQKKGRKK